jgi:DNA-binding NtrC family response regulator
MADSENILIIEDSIGKREELIQGLKMYNYNVDAVNNGKDAIEIIDSHPQHYSIVLIDQILTNDQNTISNNLDGINVIDLSPINISLS